MTSIFAENNIIVKTFLLSFICVATFTVAFGQATANPASDLVRCDEDGDGVEEFNLTTTIDEILGTQDPNNYSVGYFVTLPDAQNGTNQLPFPEGYFNITNPQTIYARVENQTNGDFDTTSFELIAIPLPILGQPNNLFVNDGDGDGIATFDLTLNDDVVSGGNPDAIVSYFTSEADAELNFNSITTPEAYTNSANPQEIFVGLFSGDCYDSNTSFTILADEVSLPDGDNDGVPDAVEDLNNNGDLTDDDTDGDTIPNFMDDDDDGDRTADEDYNNNGSPTDDDKNNNGIPDYLDESVTLSTQTFATETIAVFPNPTQHTITIQWETTTQVNTVAVYGLDGKLLTNQPVSGTHTNKTLDLSKVANGIYFIKISTQRGTVTQKVIKK